MVLRICRYFDSTENLFNVGLISKELRRKCTMPSRDLIERMEFIYFNILRDITLSLGRIRYVQNIIDGTDPIRMIAAIHAIKISSRTYQANYSTLCGTKHKRLQSLQTHSQLQ